MADTNPALWFSIFVQACLRRERESLDGRRRKLQDDKSMDEWANELSQEVEAEERKLSGLTRQDCQVGLAWSQFAEFFCCVL